MNRNLMLFGGVAVLYLLTGLFESWSLALNLLNFALLATIAALGVNMQWGYAGLFSTGVMGFTALGGLAVVLVSAKPNPENWSAGGPGILLGLALGALSVALAILAWRKLPRGRTRAVGVTAILIGGFFLFRAVYDPNVIATEAVNPENAGNIGGLGLPSLVAWPVGGLLAAAVAWAIGKIALGLRSDYLAIATLGIAEIIVAVIKNEDWLARGVKNTTQLPRPWPVPLEVDLQKDPGFLEFVAGWGLDPITTSTITVKLLYMGLFCIVLAVIIWAFERALKSPWGRMMRAIRDNEVSAAAMGKDVTRRHLQVFILGSAVIGFAGAMATSGMPEGVLKAHLVGSAEHMRLLTLGVILLLVLRFSPRGLIPEK